MAAAGTTGHKSLHEILILRRSQNSLFEGGFWGHLKPSGAVSAKPCSARCGLVRLGGSPQMSLACLTLPRPARASLGPDGLGLAHHPPTQPTHPTPCTSRAQFFRKITLVPSQPAFCEDSSAKNNFFDQNYAGQKSHFGGCFWSSVVLSLAVYGPCQPSTALLGSAWSGLARIGLAPALLGLAQRPLQRRATWA